MMKRIAILNGPNLNLLGEREPHIYGTTTLAAVEVSCRDYAKVLGVEIDFLQSNHEGVIVDQIHAARKTCAALVINPAGYSFHSIPIVDALQLFPGPLIEVHISNIHARDALHQHSIISKGVKGVICGLGTYGYIVALQAAVHAIGAMPATLPDPVRVGPV